MPRFIYTPEHLGFLSDNQSLTRAELTAAFNAQFDLQKTQPAISTICKTHRLMTGRTGHFEKGLAPFNNGTKGVTKANRTSFKKGYRPHTTLPVGTERASSQEGYLWLKLADPDVWAPKHILAWEQQHGPVPEDHLVRFNDGNPLNSNVDNLSLVNRAEHLHLNVRLRYSAAPPEIKPSLLALARLEVRIAERQRQTANA